MNRFKIFSKIYFAIILLISIFVFGILGFILIEDYTLNEAFYMTILTVSSVGFNEVRELSSEGRIFTASLIITSFGTFAYAISAITTYVLSGDFKYYYKDYKVNKEIYNINNHVIVCGFGRNGRQATESLKYETGCMIVGFKTSDGEFVINPSADTELVPNSKLFVLGQAEQIMELNKILNI